MSNHIVNDLNEALANAPGEKREPIQVGRLLAHCRQVCTEWDRGCTRFEREEWIRLLITPSRSCDRQGRGENQEDRQA